MEMLRGGWAGPPRRAVSTGLVAAELLLLGRGKPKWNEVHKSKEIRF